MFQKDMKSETQVAFAISATLSGTAPAIGNIVDTDEFGATTFCFQTGAVTDAGAAAGFTVKLQESDDTVDANFADVAAEHQVGDNLSVTDDADDFKPVGSIGYVGSKRYVRAVATGTTGTAATLNGIAVLQSPRYAPPAAIADNIAAT